MGLFAFYNGIIYNDFFALPLTLFGSCYDEQFHRKGENHDCTLAVGMDSIWMKS
jgi:V-type H+-transporting ATPase subunit a